MGCFERTASKQITSPGWMHETSARAWCTGKTQRDWVEREVGGGIGMGNTCKSTADSYQSMAKTTTLKIIKKQKNKIKSKDINMCLFFSIYFYSLEANYFTILYWFLPYIDMNQPWIYMCSPSRSHLPPPSLHLTFL